MIFKPYNLNINPEPPNPWTWLRIPYL